MAMIKKWFTLCLLFAATAFSGTQSTLNIGNRSAIVYAPDTRDNPALVFGLHGMGLSKEWAQGAFKYEQLADTANFIVVYQGGDGPQWDLGTNKDVDFIVAIIDSMYNRYQIDRNRVYASGFSMGGMMSWYLSCKIPDKIAAIVGGNGYPLRGMSGCSETRHVPALQIHGSSDDFVSYSGFVESFLPAQRERYGCPSTPVKTMPYPVDVNGRNESQLAQGSSSFMEYYGPCEKDGLTSELALLTVTGMIHDWATPDRLNTNDQEPGYLGLPLDVNGTWEAWNFMKTHSLAGEIPEVVVPSARDSIFNGQFDLGFQGWTFNIWDGDAQGSIVGDEYRIEFNELGTETHSIQLVQNGLLLEQGQSYQVSFDAYAASARTLEANVELDVSPWTSYLPDIQSFDITTTKTSYSYSFTMTNPTDSNGRVAFNMGASRETLFLDNISITKLDEPTTVSDFNAHTPSVSVIRNGAQLSVKLNANTHNLIAIVLYNLSGVEVARGDRSIDLNGLPNGIYLIEILGDGKALHHTKVVVREN